MSATDILKQKSLFSQNNLSLPARLTLNERYYGALAAAFEPFTAKRLNYLYNFLGSYQNLWQADWRTLEMTGLAEKVRRDFYDFKQHFNQTAFTKYLDSENIGLLYYYDAAYPPLLKQIGDAPLFLYYRGQLPVWDRLTLGVVGSRRADFYGEKIINNLISLDIVQQTIIISGLALGLDALAHRAALVNNGLTVAILGSGLDDKSIYPYRHRSLAREIIAQQGVLLSEYPPGTKPLAYHFPRRNRLIAGLSQAILVIEAGAKSGALITAHLALDYGRDVLAVPGDIFNSLNFGSHHLINEGAAAITSESELLTALSLTPTAGEKIENRSDLTANEQTLLAAMKSLKTAGRTITPDNIALACSLDTARVNSTLTILELKGLVKNNLFTYDLF
jgi:DNA processing protein